MHSVALALLVSALAAPASLVDDAHVLDDLGRGQVERSLARPTDLQLAVVLTRTLGDERIEDFTDAQMLTRGFTDAASRGVLLVVAVDDRHLRIAVAPSLQPYFDATFRTSLIEDTLQPEFRAGRIAIGVTDTLRRLRDEPHTPLTVTAAKLQRFKIGGVILVCIAAVLLIPRLLAWALGGLFGLLRSFWRRLFPRPEGEDADAEPYEGPSSEPSESSREAPWSEPREPAEASREETPSSPAASEPSSTPSSGTRSDDSGTSGSW